MHRLFTDRAFAPTLVGLSLAAMFHARFAAASSAAPFIDSVGAADALGLAALAGLFVGMGADKRLRRTDRALLLLAALLLPMQEWLGGAGAATLTGLVLATRPAGRLASIGQLCLGFVWIDYWGPLALHAIAPLLLPLEAALAYVAALPFNEVVLAGARITRPNGHAILVVEACSAFSNTGIAAFIWLALVRMQDDPIQSWQYRALALGLGGVVLINTARLALMTHSHAWYLALHEAPGSRIAAFCMLAVVLAIYGVGLRRANPASAG